MGRDGYHKRYSYGITFSEKTVGKLRATRLIQGPNPDSIIIAGRGDVIVKDSKFAIALNLYAHSGGKATLDLPINRPITTIFDRATLPGVQYRLELVNVTVPNYWFLFLRNVSMQGPLCEITLRDCVKILPAILGHNLTGTWN